MSPSCWGRTLRTTKTPKNGDCVACVNSGSKTEGRSWTLSVQRDGLSNKRHLDAGCLICQRHDKEKKAGGGGQCASQCSSADVTAHDQFASQQHADCCMHPVCLSGSSEEEPAVSKRHSKEKKPKKKVSARCTPPRSHVRSDLADFA